MTVVPTAMRCGGGRARRQRFVLTNPAGDPTSGDAGRGWRAVWQPGGGQNRDNDGHSRPAEAGGARSWPGQDWGGPAARIGGAKMPVGWS